MKNETKNVMSTNMGKDKPKFQQAELAELNEADLQIVSGGRAIVLNTSRTYYSPCLITPTSAC